MPKIIFKSHSVTAENLQIFENVMDKRGGTSDLGCKCGHEDCNEELVRINEVITRMSEKGYIYYLLQYASDTGLQKGMRAGFKFGLVVGILMATVAFILSLAIV